MYLHHSIPASKLRLARGFHPSIYTKSPVAAGYLANQSKQQEGHNITGECYSMFLESQDDIKHPRIWRGRQPQR